MPIDEAQVAAQLAHKNIVRMFDYGEIESQCYIAMECVHGRDLRARYQSARQLYGALARFAYGRELDRDDVSIWMKTLYARVHRIEAEQLVALLTEPGPTAGLGCRERDVEVDGFGLTRPGDGASASGV